MNLGRFILLQGAIVYARTLEKGATSAGESGGPKNSQKFERFMLAAVEFPEPSHGFFFHLSPANWPGLAGRAIGVLEQ